MPTQVQFRRGTTSENNAFSGAVGELSVDTDKNTIRVHDGSTAGGFEVVNTASTQTISNKTIGSDLLPSADSAYDLGSPSFKWKELYLSGNTLYLGNLVLKDTGGTLSIQDSAGGSLAGSFSTLTTTGNVTIGGDLTIEGATTTVNTTNLVVEDKNIVIASGAADSAAADGAGITIDNLGIYFQYDATGDTWNVNKPFGAGFNALSEYTTGEITEGSNLYYTTARADSDAKNAISGSTGITYSTATGQISTDDTQIVHDNLSGFVADEHIAHSGVTLTAGSGLNGGGDISASRTFNIDSAELYASFDHDGFNDYVANEHINHTSVTMTAGSGLTGGGDISSTRTFNIGEGTGITVSADAIATNDAEIVHDNLSGFVADEHVAHSGVTLTAGTGLNGGGDISSSRTFNIDSAELYASFDHDGFNDYVADEHIAHSGVTLTAGSGLTGGGNISASRTFNIGQGTGITVSADAIATNDAQIVHDNLSGFVADEHVAHSTVSITAGSGLTGGGTIAATRTLNIGEGTGITVSADAISTNDAEIVHDNLSGFVADEHVAHSGVTMTAGAGLTGGGTIAATRTFNVGAGTGVTVNANDIAIGQDVATTADVTFNSITTTDGLIIGGDLQVTGTTTTVNSQSLEVTDNMIYMNAGESDGSPTQSIDVGWAANVNDGGSYTHVGMFRDATDDRFKVFGTYTPEPDAALEINTGHASFTLADFQADTFYGNLTGAVTGNASTATALQTARTIGGVSFNGTSNINLPGVNTTGNQNTSGNAATATKLATARTIGLSGDVTATGVSFDGTGNITLTTAMAANSVDLTTHTTGNYVASITNGSYITGANGGSEGAGLTLAVDATSANTASKVVARDGSGNFSAGTITAALSGNATTATTLATGRTIGLSGDVTATGVSFNGGSNITLSANIASNVVGAAELNVTGNGTTAQFLRADGDGSFTWATPTDTNTTYSAGTAMDLSGTTFNLDLSELSTSTTNGDGDYFVVVDTSNAQRKLTKANIALSGFNNDAGWTSNVGDITGVTAGTGLTGGGSSGSVTLNVSGVTSSMFSSPNSLVIYNSAGTALKTIRGPGS